MTIEKIKESLRRSEEANQYSFADPTYDPDLPAWRREVLEQGRLQNYWYYRNEAFNAATAEFLLREVDRLRGAIRTHEQDRIKKFGAVNNQADQELYRAVAGPYQA